MREEEEAVEPNGAVTRDAVVVPAKSGIVCKTVSHPEINPIVLKRRRPLGSPVLTSRLPLVYLLRIPVRGHLLWWRRMTASKKPPS